MTIDPATWPIGIIPIVWFAYGIVELIGIVIFAKEPTRNTIGAMIGFVPGLVIIVAWFANYREPSEHAMWKLVVLSLVGASVWMIIKFIILSNTKLGNETNKKIDSLSALDQIKNVIFSICAFGLICVVFQLLEFRLQHPEPCTRISCESGIRILGSQFYSFGMIWFFVIFSGMVPFGVIVNLLALIRSKRN